MSEQPRYKMVRYQHADSKLYVHALIDMHEHERTLAMQGTKQPVAPQWLRDKQALLNTSEYLDR